MLGYIIPEKLELKIREYDMYSGYYCGICKSIKKRYGQMPRIVLNYDAVFLALVYSSLSHKKERIEKERCIVHPYKKRFVIYDEAGIDYAADMMLLLAYFNLLDDQQDEGGIKSYLGLFLLRRSYKKLMKVYREKCIIIKEKLDELYFLEKNKCNSLDQAAEPFAKLMEEIFVPQCFRGDEDKEGFLREIGYHIGKWIYLIDAFDDIDLDLKTKSYNPLVIQFKYNEKEESIEEFKHRIKERIEFNLFFYLAQLSKAWGQLEAVKNKELIENIIYLGLMRKTNEILWKGNTENA